MVFLKQVIPNSPLTNHQHFEIQKSLLAYSSDFILFFQNVALPPLAAPARTWESETVNMNTLATTAAAASAQIHLGSALLVSLIQPLEKESGSNNFAL